MFFYGNCARGSEVGLLVHHLDLALFPQHIGGEDADGQHHDDEDAHKAAQHAAVTGQPGREGTAPS